jgi:hypothetical protein
MIMEDTKLEVVRTFESSYYGTVTHWTPRFFDGNLGVVASLASGSDNHPNITDTLLLSDIYRIANDYIRTKSRLLPISSLESLLDSNIPISLVGRRVLEISAQWKGNNLEAPEVHIVASAYRLPRRIKEATRVDVNIATLKPSELRQWMNIRTDRHGNAVANIDTLWFRGTYTESLQVYRYRVTVSWLSDEWIVAEDASGQWYSFFLPDPDRNLALFAHAISDPTTLVHGLSPELLSMIIDSCK